MRMIDPSVALIKESDPFKKIERVGRTCYKSEDKITEDSARKFYKGLVKRQHTAMVEHATFVFEVDYETYHYLFGHQFLNYTRNYEDFRFLLPWLLYNKMDWLRLKSDFLCSLPPEDSFPHIPNNP